MILSPVLHAGSGLWMLGKIENHTAKPLTLDEINAHIAEFERLKFVAAQGFRPHQVRVIEEKKELDEKLTKLKAFIDTNPVFSSLDDVEKLRLIRQRNAMDEYSRVLADRIESFKTQPR